MTEEVPELHAPVTKSEDKRSKPLVRVLPSPVPPTESKKAAEVIADRLRLDIAKGVLREGAVLPPEGELLAHFGVSRPTLRAALRILESESLLTIGRGAQGGAKICHPSVEVTARSVGLLLHLRGTRLADFFQASSVIESAAAYAFAEAQPAEGFATLEALISKEEALVSRERGSANDAEAEAATIAFYRAVTDHCGSEILSVFGAVLQMLLIRAVDYIREHLYVRPQDQLATNERVVSDHRELLRLLKQGDAAQAERFWRAHVHWLASLYPELREARFTAL